MPKLQPPTKGFHTLNNVTYYLREGSFPYNGWLTTDDACYYIKEDGSVTTGWKEILHKHYYFDEKGVMQTNQWIDQCYVGTDGVMYVNTMTPDGIYVGNDGKEDTSLGKHNSIDGLKELRKTLEDKLASYSGKWSIYVKDIDRNEYLSINNQQIFSASLIKLFCAASAYDLIRKGTMEESERIQSLMTQMISISDNDAFNLMVAECSGVNSQIAGRPIIQAFIDQEGFQDTTITSMLLPTKFKSPSSPGRNYTTVDDFGLLLEKIYKGKCVDLESSNKLLNLLLNQSHTNKIPASLPEGIKCANKTGDTDEFQHDGAIIYGPNNVYILVIMSENGGPSINRIQELSKIVYDYFD